MLLFTALFSSCYFFLLVLCSEQSNGKKKILSLGGHDNVGAEVLHALLDADLYDVTVVIQQGSGKWLPDYAPRIRPNVNTILCGEKDSSYSPGGLAKCADLVGAIEAAPEFHAVLDFSPPEFRWVHEAADLLKGKKVGVYVYLSSDSVYEVCPERKDDKASKEEDAKRSKDPAKSEELRSSDRHGDAKLSGEEALAKQRSDAGFPWVALRVADIIGLRDTTDKWFLSQMWIQFHHALKLSLHVPAENAEQSLTFAGDVARAVFAVLEKGSEAWDTSYNVAMEEGLTVFEAVQRLASLMGEEDIENVLEVWEEKSFQLHPTVLRGPVDVRRARERLGFKATPVEEAFRAAVEWYGTAFGEMEVQRDEMKKRLVNFVAPRAKRVRSSVTAADGSKLVEEAGDGGKRRRGESGGGDKQEL